MAEDFQDLQEFLDRKNNEVLNAVKQNPLSNVLFGKDRDDEKKIIKSDSDEQLLITVNFSTVVKLKAIQITAPTDCGPSSVKLFVNPGNLDFDGAEDEDGTQEIELKPDDLKSGAKPIRLKFVKFQKVSNLSIFVPGNHDEAEQTIIQSIRFFGPCPVIEGSKPSLAQQKAASQGDWLN
eukprot:CAMPEP_0170169692 /NCGR_PEP_ID=MMETSP0040_2-20121228/2629_1 /TAXON_ID=641309 /ORGANISM="Lotharella oceanica, Strain CCMP622" /LENGTH=178 /DNA_ID=CAMNT_0010408597 /DNA_START=70 /DNA_END=606 /DNA_ORIENTATION=-